MDELLDTPAARVLRYILKHGTINQRRFTEVSTLSPPHAKKLRLKMEEKGWLVVREATVRKVTTDLEIDLSAKGRRIGAPLVAAESESER